MPYDVLYLFCAVLDSCLQAYRNKMNSRLRGYQADVDGFRTLTSTSFCSVSPRSLPPTPLLPWRCVRDLHCCARCCALINAPGGGVSKLGLQAGTLMPRARAPVEEEDRMPVTSSWAVETRMMCV